MSCRLSSCWPGSWDSIQSAPDVYACHEHGADGPDHAKGITPALGIGFHSFVDGIIYAVTFNVSVFTGVLAAIGMVLHEFPEGVITYMLLQ
jgi:zinc and cadmium transporter